jgi:hypothetical protein
MKPHIEKFAGCWFVTTSRPPVSPFGVKLRQNVLLLGAGKSCQEAWGNAARRLPFIDKRTASPTESQEG